MSELKPCPFCGGEVRFCSWSRGWSVECRNDDCYIMPETGICQSMQEAAEEWNRRAEPDYRVSPVDEYMERYGTPKQVAGYKKRRGEE